MKRVTSIILSAILVVSMAGCSSKPDDSANASSAPESGSSVDGYVLRLGTDAVGGTANTALEAMSSVVNQNTKLKTSTVVTTGAVEIINLINSGELEGGYAGTINLVQAINGEEPFASKVPEEAMLQAFGFVAWMLPIITIEGSGIETYEDLAGKKLMSPQMGSASAEVLRIVLDAYGLTDKVKLEYYGWSDGWNALKDGRVDAAMGSWANGITASGIVELTTTRNVKLLSLTPEAAAAVSAANDGIASQEMTSENDASIPEGESVIAPRNSGVVVFGANVDEEAVYQFTKACIDNVEALGNISRDLAVLKDYMTSVCVPSVPFHPGAARALKEAGLWDDTFKVYGE